MGEWLNRIRFVNDTLAFAVGHRVFKYSRDVVGIQPISTEIPNKINLYQNYPNPFNPITHIKFDIPSLGGHNQLIKVKLIVYDQLGKEIRKLVDEELNPGNYGATFDAGYFPSGIYYYHIVIHSDKLELDGFTATKKMVLIK